MKSILMFDSAYPPPTVGGKEKQAHLLSKSLLNMGCRVGALTYIHNNNKNSVDFDSVSIKRVPYNFFGNLLIVAYLLIYRFKYNFLHVHTPSRVGQMVSILGWLFRYKIIFKIPNENTVVVRRWYSRYIWKCVFYCCDALVVLENSTYDFLLKFGVGEKKIKKFPNGVVVEERKKNKTDKNILVFSARLVDQKRCIDFLWACSILHKEGFECECWILGDGPNRVELQSLAQELNINTICNFDGMVNDTIPLLRKSSVLVLPSNKEGMSNTILEAMSIGLPIVATDVGSARYQLGSYSNLFLVDVGSPLAIAKKIKLLLEDEELYEEYSLYLYERCTKVFSIKEVSKKYLNLYEMIGV